MELNVPLLEVVILICGVGASFAVGYGVRGQKINNLLEKYKNLKEWVKEVDDKQEGMLRDLEGLFSKCRVQHQNIDGDLAEIKTDIKSFNDKFTNLSSLITGLVEKVDGLTVAVNGFKKGG